MGLLGSYASSSSDSNISSSPDHFLPGQTVSILSDCLVQLLQVDRGTPPELCQADRPIGQTLHVWTSCRPCL